MSGFDRYASTYQATVQSSIDFVGLDHDFFVQAKIAVLQELVTRHFGHSARPALLDVGCGIGQIHRWLLGRFREICGVDSSRQSIEEARRRNPEVRYEVSAGASLPYSSDTFDITTSICVVHHVEPATWLEFVVELKRVTRPGGLVCLIEHNPLNPLTRLAVYRCPFDEDARLLSARHARKLLRLAGLTGVGSEHFLLFPRAVPILRTVERQLGTLPLGAQYLAWGERR